jgi:MoaA/NifB/PqqE/SkfB family radical SAM enzyme
MTVASIATPAPADSLMAVPVLRHLQVEVTGACNLRCRMCLVRYRPALDRRTALFPLHRFVALLDEASELERVTLQGLGEPLLHPDLTAMVAACAERGVRVGFNTNGTLLTARRIDALLRAGLDWLHVSVDGAHARTFETIRDGARFDKVIRNLRRVVAMRSALKADRPTVQLNAVLMRTNLPELVDLVRLAADIGVDRMWVQALSHDFRDTAGAHETYVAIRNYATAQAVWSDGGLVPPALDEARQVAGELGLDLRLPEQGPEPQPTPIAADDLPCDWPWTGAYVTHRGLVQPCCMVMGDDRVVLGDLATASLSDIWHGELYRRFRSALLTPRPPTVCRGCSLYRRVF